MGGWVLKYLSTCLLGGCWTPQWVQLTNSTAVSLRGTAVVRLKKRSLYSGPPRLNRLPFALATRTPLWWRHRTQYSNEPELSVFVWLFSKLRRTPCLSTPSQHHSSTVPYHRSALHGTGFAAAPLLHRSLAPLHCSLAATAARPLRIRTRRLLGAPSDPPHERSRSRGLVSRFRRVGWAAWRSGSPQTHGSRSRTGPGMSTDEEVR